LEITGKINYKTLRQVNLVAQNFNNPTQTTKNIAVKEKPVKTIPDNPPSDNQYLDNNQNQPPPNASPTKKTFLDSTIVGTLVDKLRGLFGSGSSNSNTQNTNSQNPNNGSGICTQIAGQTGNTALGCGNGYGNTPNTSANPYTASPYSNSNANSPVMNALLANQQAQNPNQQPSGPVTAGSEVSAGRTSGTAGDIGECRATSFAHATLREGCKADSGDQQNDQHSASGQILSRSGVPAIPAVALPSAGSFGDAVEVKDMSTGKCKAFPLLDRGPGKGPLSKGVCIDLTGSAVDILKGREPCKTVGSEGEGMEGVDKVQYALVPGDKIPVGQTKECSHL
jgi:hypothetical protein